MEYTLIYFDKADINGYIFPRTSIDIDELNHKLKRQQMFGELGYSKTYDTMIINISHTIKEFRINENENTLVADIEILSTPKGITLQENIDAYVFRPRVAGTVNNCIINVKKIFTFDAILKSTDSFKNIIDMENLNPTQKWYMKIKSNISKYLGFDVNEILNAGDAIHIFGGAVRDSITGDEINDVDVLTLPESAKLLTGVLHQHGFVHLPESSRMNIIELYRVPGIINEPITFIKIINGKIIKVQLIRPKLKLNETALTTFDKVLHNIDLSSSGLSINSFMLHVNIKNAIELCEKKQFHVNDGAFMITSRLADRKYKLIERGWKEIKN